MKVYRRGRVPGVGIRPSPLKELGDGSRTCLLLVNQIFPILVDKHSTRVEPFLILYNHMVNNLPAEETSSSPKMFLTTEELFVSHGATHNGCTSCMKPTIKLGKSLSGWIHKFNKNLMRVGLPSKVHQNSIRELHRSTPLF